MSSISCLECRRDGVRNRRAGRPISCYRARHDVRTVAMPMTSNFFGWKVAWVAFLVAVFAWGIGFYGPSVFLQTLHATRGWSVSTISAAITVHFLFSALIVAN